MKNWVLTVILLICMPIYAQSPSSEPTAPPPAVTQAAPSQLLLLNVQMGKKDKGGLVKQFQVKSGETVFIPISGALSNQPQPPTTNQLGNLAYKTDLARISDQIAKKITEIQKKQKDIDSEVYPVYRASLIIDKHRLEADLFDLHERKTKLDSQQTVKEVIQEKKEMVLGSKPPQGVVTGIYVKPILMENNVSLEMRSQGLKTKETGEIQGALNAQLGQWMQVPNQDMWVKVEKAQ